MLFAYLDPGSSSTLMQAVIALLIPLAIIVVVIWLFLHAIGEVRRAVDRNTRTVEQQTRLLEYIAKRQGILPPDGQ